MADDEWKKLSTEEKVEHKSWKARQEGYEECIKQFQRADDPKNPIYQNYLGLVKKFVIDNNEAAKDKGLDAVYAYVENIPVAAKSVGEVMPGLISKCFNGREKTKNRAFEIVLMYIEAEKQEVVSEELIKGFENKQPKVVSACLKILRRAMNEFGSKIILIKPIIKHIPKLLEDRDKDVRDEARLMAVEMYRWAGAAIMPQFQGLKEIFMKELEEEFKKCNESGEKAKQVRFLRSQQDLKAKMEAEAEAKAMNGGVSSTNGGGVSNEEVSEEAAVDPYDLLDPVDILLRLPKDFHEKLESKKWQDRKEALEALQGLLTANPKLVASDYHEVLNELKKVLAKDANIVVVGVAAKCVAGIANGLRKDFNKYVSIVLEPLVERFKEKKQNITDAVREACNALYTSTNLEALNESLIPFLSHKTPIVRQQVALFLVRCFSMSTQALLKKNVLKLYLTALIKNLSEADPSVRDSSAEAIGAAYKALGEKAVMSLLGEIEQIKLDKIKEYADKTILLNLKGEPRVQQQQQTVVVPAPVVEEKKKPTITKPTSAPAAAAAKKEEPGKKKVVVKSGDKKQPNVEKEESELSQETVDDKSVELFNQEVCTALGNSNWKDRLQSCETILNAVKRMPSDEVPTQIVVRLLGKKPGFKDSHFQVAKIKFDIILHLAQETKFTQRSAQYCVADIADKIGDVKLSEQSKNTLSKIGEAIGLSTLWPQVVGPIFEVQKSPKNQEHALLWLSQAIKEFGNQGIDMKSLVVQLKAGLANSNPSVRSATIQLIGTLYLFIGPQIRVLFESEKAALLEQIDTEIGKYKDQKAPAAIRFKKGGASVKTDDASNEDGTEETQSEPQDLMPRVDISDKLTEELMIQLNDKNWKERQAGLEKIEAILKEAKFIVANLNDFPTHLNKRLVDSNKVISQNSLRICEKLAETMGINGKKYCSTLASGMIQALTDSKEALRKMAIATLNSWFTHCGGLAPFLEGETLVESFATTNPNLKTELCNWLASVLPKSKKLPPELKALISPVYTCLEDRNADVRAAAQSLIEPLMAHVGPNEMLRVMGKAKPSSVTVIQPIIDKARADLAAKQPAAPPPPPPAPVQSSAAPTKAAASSTKQQPATKASTLTSTKSSDKLATAKQHDVSMDGDDDNKKVAGKNSKVDTKASTSKKKNEDEDLSPPIVQSNKNKRIDEEKALKTLKWNFEAPRKEFVDQLKMQLEPCVNRTLLTQMFHDDFKQHINAITTLQKAVDDASDAVISNIDLILRWLTLRFFETNPTVIVKAIEFMQGLFNMLASRNHQLVDFDASAFIPYFIQKLGDPKDPIRKGFKQIVKQISQVYPPAKVFNYLISGLASKNARQRAECLEELGHLIESIGIQPFNPQVTLKEMAKQIGDRDNSVRNAALNSITIAYQIAGEVVYKYVGKLNEKDQSMLDERIKRSAKSAAPLGPKINGTTTTTTLSQSNSHSAISSLANNNLNNSHNNDNQQDHHDTHVKQSTTKRSSIAPNSAKETTTAKESRVNSTPAKPVLQRGQTQPIISKTKGEFQLDIKEDEDDPKDMMTVKLAPHKDLDELLSLPISLPQRKNQTNYPSNILKDSQDCKEAIELVITHISHQQIDISFNYLLQIDVVIKDRDKKDLLQPHIDNLLKTCAVKLNVVHNVYMTSSDYRVEDCYRLLKGLFMVILDVFEYDLGKYCDVKTLKELMYNLLCVMIDSKINNLQDSDQLIKANNMVTLKVLELSEQTNSFCALIRLLIDCCSYDSSAKFLELIMKCIWRQIRRLSSVDSLINQLNITKVLAEIHVFLKNFPTSSWTNQVSDLPLRTIKTLLYHLAKSRQNKIFDDLKQIENVDESEIKSYIQKLAKSNFQMKGGNNLSSTTSSNGNISNSSALSISTTKQSNGHSDTFLKASNDQQFSPQPKTVAEEITAIFKKIGSSETSKQGLEDLYDFKQTHPDADLTRYYRKSTEVFVKYIEDGLKRISNERAKKENLENHSVKLNGNHHHSSSSSITSTLMQSSALTSTDMNRNAEDIMKTITDWKSKTHLNSDPADDDFTRTRRVPADQNIKAADQYLDMMNNLKKKYTRSRTEPIQKIKFDDDESEQLNDLKQLDLKVKITDNATKTNGGGFTSSTSNNNLNSESTTNSSSVTKASNENLYDEYRRRLELIKKVKPIK